MEFEVGKLYKGADETVVKCTIADSWRPGYFAGVLVSKGMSPWKEGVEFADWNKACFKEYHEPKETVITLQNGHKYNIPKGCKATITDDVIEIEEDVVYKKCLFRLSVAYVRLSNTPTIVVIDNSGSYTVKNAPITYTNDTPVEDITKEEFETAYNKAMEVLKL